MAQCLDGGYEFMYVFIKNGIRERGGGREKGSARAKKRLTELTSPEGKVDTSGQENL
jgi:hypothetical protein